ncbi:beta-glucan biosynthesis protein [Pyrenophora tritici-repentis]|nr:beta-glucan biosynthesis protein [Pyrenophora tritici-repentis]
MAQQYGSTLLDPSPLPAPTWLTVRQNHVVLEGLLAHNDLVRPTRLARLPVPDWPSHPHPPEPPRRPHLHHGQRRRVPHRPALALPARRACDQQWLHRLAPGPNVPQLALLAWYARLAEPPDDAGL